MKDIRRLSLSVMFLATFVAATPLRAQEAAALGGMAQKFQELQKIVERQNADLAEQRRRLGAIESYLVSSPGAEVQNEDYIEARSRFHSKLLRKGAYSVRR